MDKHLKIYDNHGFHYEVYVTHQPVLGMSLAVYRGETIARRSYSRGPLPPWGDSDAEQESYQERLAEWCEAAETDLTLGCQEYFNRIHS